MTTTTKLSAEAVVGLIERLYSEMASNQRPDYLKCAGYVGELRDEELQELMRTNNSLLAELSRVSARLAEAVGLIERARMNTDDCYVSWHEAARAFLNPGEVTK